jgi:hypothetical protein
MIRLKRFLGDKQSLDLIEYTLLISFIVRSSSTAGEGLKKKRAGTSGMVASC